MKSAKAVAKTPLMQPNDEGLEFESENLAEVPPEGEAIQNAAPQERPPAREETHPSTEVIAFPSPEMDPTWEKVEVSLRKILSDGASVHDHATIVAAGLTGDTLKREIFRIGQVAKHRVHAGSRKRLEELRGIAFDTTSRVHLARTALLKSLAERLAEAERIAIGIRQEIATADREASDAVTAVETMESANRKLRDLVPHYLVMFHGSLMSQLSTRLRQPLDSLHQKIVAYERIRDLDPLNCGPSQIDHWRSAREQSQKFGFDSADGWVWFSRCIDEYGLELKLNSAAQRFLETIKAKVSEELPVLKMEAKTRQHDLDFERCRADAELDVYLPKE